MNHVTPYSEAALPRRPQARSSGISRAEHSAYLTRIREFPVLSEREEQRLIRGWYDNGDRRAYDALIGSHLRLVPKIAQKYVGYGVPLADLIGEGNLGLLQSAERFDPEKGFRFSTYARWWIKAAMLNYVLQTWSLIKVGNDALERLDRREKNIVRQRYLSEEPSTLASIAAAYGLTADVYGRSKPKPSASYADI